MTYNPNDEILSVREAADLLKLSTVTVQRWCRNQRIPSIKVGNRYRIRKSDLMSIFNRAAVNNHPYADAGTSK